MKNAHTYVTCKRNILPCIYWSTFNAVWKALIQDSHPVSKKYRVKESFTPQIKVYLWCHGIATLKIATATWLKRFHFVGIKSIHTTATGPLRWHHREGIHYRSRGKHWSRAGWQWPLHFPRCYIARFPCCRHIVLSLCSLCLPPPSWRVCLLASLQPVTPLPLPPEVWQHQMTV